MHCYTNHSLQTTHPELATLDYPASKTPTAGPDNYRMNLMPPPLMRLLNRPIAAVVLVACALATPTLAAPLSANSLPPEVEALLARAKVPR